MDAGAQSSSPAQTPELVAHERTYKAFNLLLRWCMTALAASITGLVLWFVSGAGFWGAFVTAVVIFALGYAFLVRSEADKDIDVWSPDR